ncbi:MAG: glycoside hydrolase family 5 protein [Saccharofermentans sp.]|nr:glycoside hydrolase family 5 protein [Saccharofermentans sp.]
MSKLYRKTISAVITVMFIICAFPVQVLAAPSGSATTNCWGSGGQIEVQLSGCDGYATITVVAEFSGSISSASGWGFDTYTISGNQVTATCSASGPNNWGFNSKVGIQVTGSDINSASLISVSGDGESGSVTETSPTTQSTAAQSGGGSGASSNVSVTISGPAENTAGVAGDDWLTTDGSKIVDMNGDEVWLTGVNWFGYNTGTNLFDGVWNCNLKESIEGIADHGFNLLRIPMSAELLLQWKNGEYPQANYNQAYNSELNSLNSLEIFDYVLQLCEENGIKVMIDIHTVKTDASGHNYPLWYREDMTTEDFIEALTWIAERYKNNDTIIAYDLKNEPHGKASESEFAIWNDSTKENNWKMVAEEAGNAILDVNPNVLIVIEGIQIYPIDPVGNDFTSTNDEDYYNTWWGGNLMAVKDYPIDFGSEERNKQIVYSPHDYGPLVYEQPWFEGGFSFDSLYKDAWYDYWLYIEEEDIAPILIGEWGGFMDGGPNEEWMTYLRQLIAEKNIHFTFWCYNANSGDTGGLVLDDFTTWDEEKYEFVKQVLWQNEDGQFIGLDHEVPLGKNGISLSEYSGKEVIPVATPAETSAVSEDNAPDTTDAAVTTEAVATEGVICPAEEEQAAAAPNGFVIAGIALGGTAALAAIVIIVFGVIQKKRKSSDNIEDTDKQRE